MPSPSTEATPGDRSAYPLPSELLPHAGRMNWLESVASHTREATSCRARIPADTPLTSEDGSVPGFAALELMAQCAAVHASLEVRHGAAQAAGADDAGSAAARAGAAFAEARILLLGTRALEIGRETLTPGERLEVEAVAASFASSGLAVLSCCVRDASGCEVARARLNLFAPVHA